MNLHFKSLSIAKVEVKKFPENLKQISSKPWLTFVSFVRYMPASVEELSMSRSVFFLCVDPNLLLRSRNIVPENEREFLLIHATLTSKEAVNFVGVRLNLLSVCYEQICVLGNNVRSFV